MNTLIVDDDPLVHLTLHHLIEKAHGGATCTHASDGPAALRSLSSGRYDVVFLDLELPELDGRSVLMALPPGLPVIVVSAHTDFAARSYDFDVVDYLVKPLEFPRFHRAWQRLLARRGKSGATGGGTIVVRDGNKLVQIALDRLLYLQAESNYTLFVCSDRSLLTLMSLKQLSETLPREFMRVHRSYIVNTRLIDQIEGATIRIGTHKVPISGTYRKELLAALSPVN